MENNIIPKIDGEKEQGWHVGVFQALEAVELSAGNGIDPATQPEWVVNVLKQLAQQTMPVVSLKAGEFTPRRLGRLLGQQQANWDAIEKALAGAGTPEGISQFEAMLERLFQNADNPAVASFIKAIEFGGNLLEGAESFIGQFTAITVKALRKAWEQPNCLERLAFFHGLAEGLSKPGWPSRPTDATPIYLRLLVHRAEIQQLKSVRELREFLHRCGLSEQILGHPKRLEKICERIGLSFAKVGRPKAGEIPTT